MKMLKNIVEIGKKILKFYYYRFIHLFGYKFDIKDIPEGQYCYKFESGLIYPEGYNSQSKLEDLPEMPYYKTKMCPYFISLDGNNSACIFCGHIGFDMCHWDACKICGVKNEIDKRDIEN